MDSLYICFNSLGNNERNGTEKSKHPANKEKKAFFFRKIEVHFWLNQWLLSLRLFAHFFYIESLLF